MTFSERTEITPLRNRLDALIAMVEAVWKCGWAFLSDGVWRGRRGIYIGVPLTVVQSNTPLDKIHAVRVRL